MSRKHPAIVFWSAALFAAMWLFGCAGVHRPVDLTVAPPLLPDPGPASARPLPEQFDVLAADPRSHGLVRALVELREQVDLHALSRAEWEMKLGRRAAGELTRQVLAALAKRSQAELLETLDALVDAGKVDYFETIRFRNRVFISVHPEVLETLRQHPDVAELIPEYDGVREAKRKAGRGFAAKAPPIPPGDSWGVELLELRSLWEQGIDGRGVVVGILDSGVMPEHLALVGNRSESFWYDPVTGSPAAFDSVPHGSMVLSCAVGQEVDGRALGTAPGARWVAAMSNYHNSYNNVNMSLAADWLIFENRIDVLLGAWGHGSASCDPRDFPMVEALRAAGIVPVFAAGNDGPDERTGQTPAQLTGLFPVGRGPLAIAAIDHNRQVVDASSRGPRLCGSDLPFPDVAAPGWKVPVPSAPMPNSLTLASGTSFSVGWVGGVVAMVQQIAPDMPVWDIEDLIRRTAQDLPPEGHDTLSGYGLLDPAAAVAAAQAWADRHP